jgi:hypothetical protein
MVSGESRPLRSFMLSDAKVFSTTRKAPARSILNPVNINTVLDYTLRASTLSFSVHEARPSYS